MGMAPLIVAGVDLSLTGTGLSIIEIEPPPNFTPNTTIRCETIVSTGRRADTLQQRVARRRKLRNAICDRIRIADVVVIEGPAYSAHGSGTWDRAGLWAAVVDTVDHLKIPYLDVPPTKAKQFAAGKGNADKTAVAAGITRLWGDHVTPGNDNEFDATALASLAAVHYAGRQLPIRVLERHREVVSSIDWPQLRHQ